MKKYFNTILCLSFISFVSIHASSQNLPNHDTKKYEKKHTDQLQNYLKKNNYYYNGYNPWTLQGYKPLLQRRYLKYLCDKQVNIYLRFKTYAAWHENYEELIKTETIMEVPFENLNLEKKQTIIKFVHTSEAIEDSNLPQIIGWNDRLGTIGACIYAAGYSSHNDTVQKIGLYSLGIFALVNIPLRLRQAYNFYQYKHTLNKALNEHAPKAAPQQYQYPKIM